MIQIKIGELEDKYNNKKHMTISHVLLKYIGVISERLYIIHVIKLECDSELNNFITIFSFLYNRIVLTEIIRCVDIRRSMEETACLKEHTDHRECRCRAISGCWNTIS